MWAVVQSAVCTALGGKTPVIPWRLEGLAGPDRAECPADDLFNDRGKNKVKKNGDNVELITIPGTLSSTVTTKKNKQSNILMQTHISILETIPAEIVSLAIKCNFFDVGVITPVVNIVSSMIMMNDWL